MVISGRLRWFGRPWGAAINEDCEQVEVPVGELCARCETKIDPHDQGVQVWHVEQAADQPMYVGQYKPLHYACFMRQTTGGIGHVLLHGTGACDGRCPPDPEWLSKRRAAEIAEELWQRARIAGA